MVNQPPLPDIDQGSFLAIDRPNNDLRLQTITVVEDPSLELSNIEEVPQPFSAEVTSRVEHANLMLDALKHLGERRRASGYLKHDATQQGHAVFTERYKAAEQTVRTEQTFRVPTASQRTFDSFSKAYTAGLSAESMPSAEDLHDEYVQWNHKFSDPANRRKYRAQLRRTLKLVADMPAPVGDTYQESDRDTSPELLDSRQRMVAIRDDERAGFLPANHKQKTMAFDMLTFLDPTMHRGGVYERLRMIADHQIKVYRNKGASMGEAKMEGRRAVTSIMHEMADHITDAQHAIANLEQAKRILDETPNQRLTLAEALADHPDITAGFNEFIRFIDIKRLRDEGITSMPFDPLGPKRNETHDTVREGQNKRLDDPYTGEVRPESAEEYVEEQLNTVTIFEARKQWPAVLDNEYKKLAFFTYVMRDIRAPYRAEAQEILATVRPDITAA
jgi:hypothetical protein